MDSDEGVIVLLRKQYGEKFLLWIAKGEECLEGTFSTCANWKKSPESHSLALGISWYSAAVDFFFFLIDKKQIYYKAKQTKKPKVRFQIIHRKYTKRNPKG